jgi:hypothetical protein
MRDRGSSGVRGVSNEQQSSLQGIPMAMRDGYCFVLLCFTSHQLISLIIFLWF